MSELLELAGVTAGYGSLAVVRGLDLHVAEGEIVTLLGPNGAGKTTTLLTACGVLRALGGEVRVCGRPLDGRHPSEAARRGVSLVPEDRALFFDLTVVENLRVGSHGHRRAVGRMFDLFPELTTLRRRKAGLLSGGQQQMPRLRAGSPPSPGCWSSTR